MTGLHHPFRELLEALMAKDAELFARYSHLDPSSFVVEWKKVHPEDFPHGLASEASSRSVVPTSEPSNAIVDEGMETPK